MPSYKIHLVGGALTGLALLQLPNLCSMSVTYRLEFFGCALLGALFPDIDIKSKGQKIFYSLLIAVACAALVSGMPTHALTMIVPGCIPLVVRHRGITHSFIATLGFTAIIFLLLHIQSASAILKYDLLFFSAGIISHLWLDRGFARMIRF